MGEARSGGGLARMGKLKRMGLLPGVADLIFIKEGRAYFLELKRTKGKQSANQLIFEADAIRAGALYAVVYSFDDAVLKLMAWGIIS